MNWLACVFLNVIIFYPGLLSIPVAQRIFQDCIASAHLELVDDDNGIDIQGLWARGTKPGFAMSCRDWVRSWCTHQSYSTRDTKSII